MQILTISVYRIKFHFKRTWQVWEEFSRLPEPTSSSVSFSPRLVITWRSSAALMKPLPSLSKTLKASLISSSLKYEIRLKKFTVIPNFIKWQLIWQHFEDGREGQERKKILFCKSRGRDISSMTIKNALNAILWVFRFMSAYIPNLTHTSFFQKKTIFHF